MVCESAQARALRPDLVVRPLRGNIETRMAKVLGPEPTGPGAADALDATILALAGLKRAGMVATHGPRITPLETDVFLPAAGQGALVVQAMSGNAFAVDRVAALEDADSRQALEAERAVVRGLDAGCQSCLAVHVGPDGEGGWRGRGMAARNDGTAMVRAESRAETADRAAQVLLGMLRERGAAELLARD